MSNARFGCTTKAPTMEAPPLSFCYSHSHSAVRLVKEMLAQDYALPGVAISPGDRTQFDVSPSVLSLTKHAGPLSPHQAIAKRSTKPAGTMRSVARRKKPRSSPKNVLVVDDVQDVTEMIALFLKHAGYQVATADSASRALQLAEERNFDLIISDIGMPQLNVYELAEALRRLSKYQSIPMIAVTGSC